MRVVNKRTHKPTSKDLYIGRPSKYGNPFSIGKDGTREEVIEKYRHYLWSLMQEDTQATQDILALGEYENLVCWCAPQACHGDVLVRAYHWLTDRNPS